MNDVLRQVYVADTNNNAIRIINMNTLEVSVLAGGNGPDTAGVEDGVSWDAQFDHPTQLGMMKGTTSDRLYVLEQNQYRIRSIALPIAVVPFASTVAVMPQTPYPYTFTLTRPCYEDAVATIATGGLLLVNDTNTLVTPVKAGVSSISVIFSYPVDPSTSASVNIS